MCPHACTGRSSRIVRPGLRKNQNPTGNKMASKSRCLHGFSMKLSRTQQCAKERRAAEENQLSWDCYERQGGHHEGLLLSWRRPHTPFVSAPGDPGTTKRLLIAPPRRARRITHLASTEAIITTTAAEAEINGLGVRWRTYSLAVPTDPQLRPTMAWYSLRHPMLLTVSLSLLDGFGSLRVSTREREESTSTQQRAACGC